MKSAIALLSTFSAFAHLKGDEQSDFVRFQRWIKEHDKEYESPAELSYRFRAFRDFLDLVDERNAANFKAGGEDNVHGLTKFADLTQAEFADMYLMKEGYYKPRTDHDGSWVPQPINATAGNVDWRSKNVISPVKDQGQCGSCWAFSATEAVESYGALNSATGYSIGTTLSSQQSCSCTYSYNGCNGGNPQNVYGTAIQNHGGEESNAEYPYTVNCATCSATKTKYVNCNGYTNVRQGSLQSTLDTSGPPSVCVAAESWNTYRGGVMTSCAGSIDHCVQAVGYMNSGVSTAYWIVRNSWGTSWGERGYIYLAMAGDTCKVQDDINYPHTTHV